MVILSEYQRSFQQVSLANINAIAFHVLLNYSKNKMAVALTPVLVQYFNRVTKNFLITKHVFIDKETFNIQALANLRTGPFEFNDLFKLIFFFLDILHRHLGIELLRHGLYYLKKTLTYT